MSGAPSTSWFFFHGYDNERKKVYTMLYVVFDNFFLKIVFLLHPVSLVPHLKAGPDIVYTLDMDKKSDRSCND